VLHFNTDKGVLNAIADSALIIENRGLGYKVSFLLENFSYDKLAHKVLYKGQIMFTQLTPENEKQTIQCAGNRLKAYYGSELHFMRALYNNKLIQEGFFFNLFNEGDDGALANTATSDAEMIVKSKIFNTRMKIRTINNYKRILDTIQSTPTRPVLSFSGQLEVKYIHEAEPPSYIHLKEPGSLGHTLPQKSRLTLLKPGVSIEPNGTVVSEEDIETIGYWSWEMIAENLPIDYYPEEDINVVTTTNPEEIK
jgi:hypothetical protein